MPEESKTVDELMPMFRWAHFNVSLRGMETERVSGIVIGAFGIWIEWPCTRSEMFKLTHLPTGLCLLSSGMLPHAMNTAERVHKLEENYDLWAPAEDTLVKIGTIVRGGRAPGPLADDYKLHWGVNARPQNEGTRNNG